MSGVQHEPPSQIGNRSIIADAPKIPTQAKSNAINNNNGSNSNNNNNENENTNINRDNVNSNNNDNIDAATANKNINESPFDEPQPQPPNHEHQYAVQPQSQARGNLHTLSQTYASHIQQQSQQQSHAHLPSASIQDKPQNQQIEEQKLIDNPCWGGPQSHEHDLSYLLHLISSGKFNYDSIKRDETIILHNDNDFLVIDKPPDLRMDGPYPATVHKLVTYWFPPPTLTQSLLAEQDTNGTDTTDLAQAKHRSALLQSIQKLSTHNDLKDNIIRTTHQLDYATSGVLLMAKSKKAAGTACSAFQDRLAKKEYLAIVHQNIGIDFPILTPYQEKIFDKWMDGSLELKHRKHRRDMVNRKGKTFVGYLPSHSIFAKWKGMRQKRKKRKWEDGGGGGAGNGVNNGTGASQDEMSRSDSHTSYSMSQQEKDRVCRILESSRAANAMQQPHQQQSSQQQQQTQQQQQQHKFRCDHADALLLKGLPGLEKDEEDGLVNSGWKDIKLNSKYKAIFHDLAKAYNEIVGESLVSQGQGQGKDEYGKYHYSESGSLSGSTGGSAAEKLPTFFRRKGESEDAFYCQAPLAEDPDSFRVVVYPEALQECSSDIRSKYGRSQTEDGKELDFKPSLTRCVVLKRGFWNGLPVTKMLLQPRTGRRHQLRLHTAILGHAILGDCTYELGDNTMERKTCNRMCLHAHKLSIPLGYKKIKVFTAPDPFVGVI
jgi:23S rRNA-/tRNA-specific pseudouridylate synthase